MRSWPSSVAPGAATLVILMGTSKRAEIVEALTGAGWRESMPAAIVWNASLPEQTVWTGTLAQLHRSERAPVAMRDAPGTIVVGEVVALRESLTTTAMAAGRCRRRCVMDERCS